MKTAKDFRTKDIMNKFYRMGAAALYQAYHYEQACGCVKHGCTASMI